MNKTTTAVLLGGLVAGACGSAPSAAAQALAATTPSTATATALPLRVAVSEVPPFAIQQADGSWRGISVDLWREVATSLGYTTACAAATLARPCAELPAP